MFCVVRYSALVIDTCLCSSEPFTEDCSTETDPEKKTNYFKTTDTVTDEVTVEIGLATDIGSL